MKKAVVLLMIVAMIAVLAACSKNEGGDSKANTEPTKAVETTPAETIPTQEAKPTEAPAVTEEPTAEPTAEPTEEPTAEPTEEPIDDTDVHERDALGNLAEVYYVDKSEMIGTITDITELVEDEYYVFTMDFRMPIWLPYEELSDKKVGDKVMVNGEYVTISQILSIDENYTYTIPHDSYEDGCIVTVIPDEDDFFDNLLIDTELYMNVYDDTEFAFYPFNEDGVFYAFAEWGLEELYYQMYIPTLHGVNLVVSNETEAEIVNYSYADYPDGAPIVNGVDYVKLRLGEIEMENMHVYDSTEVYISEVVGEDGAYTGEISSIREIFVS
ncbi:MAG: hypothetical protein K6E47_08385 [Lachnospiraceae bacterium]|nr:hypothetical protein [Lachnospiraceae bacterium]